ncbi:MAG: S46 family peptidase, partial [Prevotella sp.]|nr:S46 family peptidase [Prevotella sp.]
APVSMQGYKDGDFSMTIGYPGSTNRYLSSYGIRQMREAENSTRAQVRGVKQEVMKKHMDASEAVRIKYDSKYAQSSNYWKNSIGMNKCIDSIGIIRQKAEYEQKIQAFQDKTGYLKGQLDFGKMKQLYDEVLEPTRSIYYFMETFRRTNELTTRAMRVNGAGYELKGPDGKPNKQYFEIPDNSEEWDEALDKEVLAVLLDNYKKHVPAKDLPAFYQTISKKYKNNYAKYVNDVYKKSCLMKGKKIYPNKKKYLKDPGVQMGLDLMACYSEIQQNLPEKMQEIALQEKYLCAAKLRMEEDMPHYSDANFTMRLSYGQVGEYLLNGKPSGYYTTAESIVEKMKKADLIEEYYAEPVMHELLGAKDFGKYTDPRTGKMQLCFLTNNDITGGNSGSPMFNGKGELIGLAFDGNWDSLSSDIFFDTKLARCIGVDIRYVLFMMDKWGHADRLIKEINAR